MTTVLIIEETEFVLYVYVCARHTCMLCVVNVLKFEFLKKRLIKTCRIFVVKNLKIANSV